MRNDPAFALEVDWCTEKGIPHSLFLAWDPEDRAKVVASLLEKAERCQLCGTAKWEWKENRFAFEPVEDFCQGCYYQDIAKEERQSMPGVTIRMVPSSSITDEMRGGKPGEG